MSFCDTQEYRAWYDARSRCFDRNNVQYSDYGGRGITMCPEWASDYCAFLSHIGPKPHRKLVLDRIDNDGNYEPGNVRWTTRSISNLNKRYTKKGHGAHFDRPAPILRRHNG